ncbi:MAG TPA: deoxyribodipyrimidine photo-lyase [bacterium]|nr:deoxyribodipyrimidine photo-lyase [bacterium]HMW36464.1 deoxyribodipyrimidine photo-lyase [bacterium]HMY37555.1 deoxyribodipyrimidine photo-lyase [bacterium]HMZ05812.1 deoxyribodipyrimidine photo-lyase [bacterium]HNB10070.1 deoxyribodipyrimidine photo-lyase [bacterium]
MQHSIVWLRRDLRLDDNTALLHAMKASQFVSLIFIFDKHILDRLPADDRRLSFIYESLTYLQNKLKAHGAPTVHIFYGEPEVVIPQLFSENKTDALFFNHDYEPYANVRDTAITEVLNQKGILVHSFKDQVIFEKSEIVKDDGTPYKVFTAYKNRWLNTYTHSYPNAITDSTSIPWKKFSPLFSSLPLIHSLQEIGFVQCENIIHGGSDAAQKQWTQFTGDYIEKYDTQRDLPGLNATSHLAPHLRFGTISVRQLIDYLSKHEAPAVKVFLSELIWREFFMMILWHFPHVIIRSFQPQFDRIVWSNREDWFEAWKSGHTGYPIVDAGMRELHATGYMHNRVRMIVASFLVKHLHIDWRKGEAYFAEKLLDYELSSNNGNWQWAAGTGVDAAPYFRIFNPLTQGKKFDPDAVYIRRWVPELENVSLREIHDPIKRQSGLFSHYPHPIIDLDQERQKCLALYKV